MHASLAARPSVTLNGARLLMLRLLHTSDWHLGHTLHGRDRRFEHAAFLRWLLDTLVEARADALVIAGDVFETANPPATAIADFNEFLAAARRRMPKLDIVVTAGNHDSAQRLDAMAPLLGFANIHVVGALPRDAEQRLDLDRLLIPLHDADDQVAAWLAAVPFLRIADLPLARAESDASGSDDQVEVLDPLIAGVASIYATVLSGAQARAQPDQALIATGHLYMRGGSVSELSERKLLGGNQHAIPRSIFADWSYVALGHLHLAQAVEQSELVRYCGSPLPLSLNEADYPHQVLLASFEGSELVVCQSFPVPRAVDVMRVPAEAAKPLDSVLFELEQLPLDPTLERDRWPWLEVRVSLDEPQPDLRARIDRVLRSRPVRLLKISVERSGVGGSLADFPDRRELERIDPQQVFIDCYERSYADRPDTELLAAFHELRDAVERGDALGATLSAKLGVSAAAEVVEP